MLNHSAAPCLKLHHFICAFGSTAPGNKEKLENIRLAAGLGGSLDVFAGVVKRAPKLFIKMKLEWFYRLIKEPRRIGRMMKLPKYILGAYREKR